VESFNDLFKRVRAAGYQVVVSSAVEGDAVTAWINKGETTKTATVANGWTPHQALRRAFDIANR